MKPLPALDLNSEAGCHPIEVGSVATARAKNEPRKVSAGITANFHFDDGVLIETGFVTHHQSVHGRQSSLRVTLRPRLAVTLGSKDALGEPGRRRAQRAGRQIIQSFRQAFLMQTGSGETSARHPSTSTKAN